MGGEECDMLKKKKEKEKKKEKHTEREVGNERAARVIWDYLTCTFFIGVVLRRTMGGRMACESGRVRRMVRGAG